MTRLIKEMFILGITAVAGIYLVNPTAGILELIPDIVPFIGNLDEASAALIVLASLRYYGLDLTRLFQRDQAQPPDAAQPHIPRQWNPNLQQPPVYPQQTVVTPEHEADKVKRGR